jgi:hypothetical protein
VIETEQETGMDGWREGGREREICTDFNGVLVRYVEVGGHTATLPLQKEIRESTSMYR